MGRSGTKFLSSLLELDANISVGHETIGNREYWLLSWYLGETYQIPFLKNEKSKFEKSKTASIVVDVNSYLQNSAETLVKVFDKSEVFHLVRDPRKVVPSIYTRRDDSRIHKIPKTAIEIEQWIKMNKLQQVCYNWTQTTNSLIDSGLKIIKFEEMTSDYAYLKAHVLEPIGANISLEQFENFKKVKVNRTRSKLYRYFYAKYKGKSFINKQANFDDFSREQKEMFFDICGSTMAKLNYTK
jgi:hypothetical protein